MNPERGPSFCLIVISSLLLLAGCGQPPAGQTGSAQKGAAEAAKQEKMIEELSQRILSLYPYVKKSELACMTGDFRSFFQLSSNRPIPAHPLTFKVQDLLALLPPVTTCDPGKGCFRGVEVYFGLDEHSEFDVAVEMVTLTYNPASDTYAIGHAPTYYRVLGGKLEDQKSTISKWQQDQGKRYADSVMVQLDGSTSTFDRFKYGRDVTSVVLPYEGELDSLIIDNNLMNGMLEVLATCEPLSRDTNLIDHDRRQGICVVPVGVTLTDTITGRHFAGKGADLGSPCPPTCDDAHFRDKGLPHKPGC